MNDKEILDRIFGLSPSSFNADRVWQWLFEEIGRDLDVSSPEAEGNNAMRLNRLLRLASELGFHDLVTTHMSAQMSPATFEKLMAHAPES